MESEYFYSFTDRAEQDLDGIMHYIAVELSNSAAADKLFSKIFESIDAIRAFPDSGLLVENEFLADKTVRRVLADNYIIYYKLSEEKKSVYVLRIVYGKRNLDDILQSI